MSGLNLFFIIVLVVLSYLLSILEMTFEITFEQVINSVLCEPSKLCVYIRLTLKGLI